MQTDPISIAPPDTNRRDFLISVLEAMLSELNTLDDLATSPKQENKPVQSMYRAISGVLTSPGGSYEYREHIRPDYFIFILQNSDATNHVAVTITLQDGNNITVYVPPTSVDGQYGTHVKVVLPAFSERFKITAPSIARGLAYTVFSVAGFSPNIVGIMV